LHQSQLSASAALSVGRKNKKWRWKKEVCPQADPLSRHRCLFRRGVVACENAGRLARRGVRHHAGQVPAGQVCKVAFDAPLNGKTARVMGIAKVAYSILNTEGFRTGLQFVQIDAANLKTLTDLMA
jgi:hypothetical protein